MLKKLISLTIAAAVSVAAIALNPKREFRGAWLHTVYQPQYAQKSTLELKKYLADQLDKLHAAGVNAVLFQVRPSADAFYDSKLEPWSHFLTKGGKAPAPYWDPLQYMIDEAHKRGMELHAWLNPYRVTTSSTQKLPASHIYHKEPNRFVTFAGDKKMYFDPGLPENRTFIEDVVADIVSRYDVDGIHFDDYFYPYPVKGYDFPDDASFKRYGNGMKRADWRRHNVDLLIEGVHKRIVAIKPWVRFGISPFGIWRNQRTDPRGSETKGLQNYDDLYADVLPWAQKGWVDYLLPQLYWELEHKSASYLVLVDWWNRNAGGRHMYIGQDVERTMKAADIAPSTQLSQLRHKVELTRNADNIQGNCWWPGYSVTANFGGVADSLKSDLQSTPALVPEYPWISTEHPAKVEDVKVSDGTLRWAAPKQHGKTVDVVRYVVYRFDVKTKRPDFDSSEHIVAVVGTNSFEVKHPGKYYVTALNRANVESPPSDPVTVK
jgi:uncharacterized lipoprotein YddW (UPF0748 family)